MNAKLVALTLVATLSAGGAALAQASDGVPKTQINKQSAFPEMVTGEQVYKGVCQACHMPDAKGAVGSAAYPALAKNQMIGTAAYPVVVLLKGQKAMPAFGDMLSDEQIAGVVTYIRTNFGNKYKDKVTATDVAELRKAP